MRGFLFGAGALMSDFVVCQDAAVRSIAMKELKVLRKANVLRKRKADIRAAMREAEKV